MIGDTNVVSDCSSFANSDDHQLQVVEICMRIPDVNHGIHSMSVVFSFDVK